MIEHSSELALEVYAQLQHKTEKVETEIKSVLTEQEVKLLQHVYERMTVSKGKVLYKSENTKVSAILATILSNYYNVLQLYNEDTDTKTQLLTILLKLKKPQHKAKKRKVL